MNRDEAIKAIAAALKRRSGKSWSVTGGRGTAYGWITIDAPPRLRTAHSVLKDGAIPGPPESYEIRDTGQPNGCTPKPLLDELARLMGLESVHCQGLSIPASSADYAWAIAKAEGRESGAQPEPYWD